MAIWDNLTPDVHAILVFSFLFNRPTKTPAAGSWSDPPSWPLASSAVYNHNLQDLEDRRQKEPNELLVKVHYALRR